ncbi:VOC family protein [Geodermatophilus sp. YIM 151500]|uniref:VOC family protein n=1 Tax=Geodermatophilus sp. YIM 151500 TaxID=2984531 RepID=UPI0021E3C7E2|nr:VOC family protein [Geodermatophilus sp. YIM 151500]MCV2489265.1 VOC family protein [Geodermatophilus sp. YIM 151500]
MDLGEGTPRSAPRPARPDLELIGVQPIRSGAVTLSYRPASSTPAEGPAHPDRWSAGRPAGSPAIETYANGGPGAWLGVPALAEHASSEGVLVPVQLNHTIVSARDKQRSATFLADLLGLAAPSSFGPFAVVQLDNDVSLDFMDDDPVHPRHYAFLVTEDEFDAIFGRIRARGLDFWADPFERQPERINTNDGGRGVYWKDPDGHVLEIITRPYGG